MFGWFHAGCFVGLSGGAASVSASRERVPLVEDVVVHVDSLVFAFAACLVCATVPVEAERRLLPLEVLVAFPVGARVRLGCFEDGFASVDDLSELVAWRALAWCDAGDAGVGDDLADTVEAAL